MKNVPGRQFPQRSARRAALVLGGGGTFGVIQAAYIHAAIEAGFRPDVVVGTSVGALNGAWVALHPDQPDELLRIWLGLDHLKLVRVNPFRMASKLVRKPLALSQNHVVPQLIETHLGSKTFDDARLPLAIVATNLSRGAKHVFREGSLHDAILASTAIPAVFDPVELDGELFVDGGLSASVDLATAVEMGATEILAIDLTPPPSTVRPKTVLGVLKQSFGILAHATTDAMEACVGRQIPVRVVRPDLSRQSPWELDDSAGAIAHNLVVARGEIAGILDRRGHVRPRDPVRPATAHLEPVTMDRFFHAHRQAG
jgi:NTE family protein